MFNRIIIVGVPYETTDYGCNEVGKTDNKGVKMNKVKERIIDWNHVYLLGWYGPDEKPYLTTWIDTEESRRNYITVVVTGPGVQKWGPPIWMAPANCKPNPYGVPSHHYSEYQLHEVKPDEDANQKARELGGVKAIGWYFEKGVERKWEI